MLNRIACFFGLHDYVHKRTIQPFLFHRKYNDVTIKVYQCRHCGKIKDIHIHNGF